MISLVNVKRFCKEYWLIENYQEAVNDTEQVWDCHHRHEIDWALSKEDLISIGRYYDVHYSELIFIPHGDHTRLHMKGNTWNNGKHHAEETRAKQSDAMKGENNPMYGKEGAFKGKHHTEEAKTKISDAKKGNQNSLKYMITEEELYDLYVVQGLSLNQIASMYECDPTTILYKLKKYNIKKWK